MPDTSLGKLTLDVSGIKQGAQTVGESMKKIDDSMESSQQTTATYAQTLSSTLSHAYEQVAAGVAKVQQAQQAAAQILNTNQKKQESYTEVIVAAQKKQEAAEQRVIALQEQAKKAIEARIAQQQKINELQQKNGVTNEQIAKIIERLNSLQNAEVEVNKQLTVALTQQKKAAEDVAKAKEKAAKAELGSDSGVVSAQANLKEIEKLAQQEIKVVQSSVAKIEQTRIQSENKANAQIESARIVSENKKAATIQSAEIAAQAKIEAARIQSENKANADIEKVKIKGAQQAAQKAAEAEKKEREKATEDAKREQERAAQEVANNQALAFGIAANAVHEVINLVKQLASEMLNLAKDIVEVGSSFEQSMATVAATSGMTASDVANNISDYKALVDAAREAGETTMFTATQAGEALNYLALAGYSVEESINAMPDILTIAAAGAMDLGTASDMVTDAMNALDMEVEETGAFIDKMARTAQSSNTNVEQLGRAILTVGGTATVLAGGVTELDTALGIMANSGIKAQQGGTSLRQILLNLTDPSEKAAKMIEEIGLQVFDTTGNLRPLNEVFGDLDGILEDMSDQDRMQILGQIFDARHIRAAQALMQGYGEDWDELENKIENADGAAEKMADVMMSTLTGAMTTAKSAVESIEITINEGLRQNLTDLVNQAIPKLRDLNDVLASPAVQSRLEQLSASIEKIGLLILDKVVEYVPKIIDWLSNLEAHIESLRIIVSTFLALKIVYHLQDITKAMVGLLNFIVTNPYIALAAAVAAVAVAFVELYNAAEASHKAMMDAAITEADTFAEQRNQIQSTVDTWNEYKATADEVTDQAFEQQATVRALYQEYNRLRVEGEDTTLAMEALADEIPELKQMLTEGEVSFEDITKAVDDYCDSLIKAAQIEADKQAYMASLTTLNALQANLEELNAERMRSFEAYQQAQRDLEYFDKTYEPNLFSPQWVKDKRKELEQNVEIAGDIFAKNTATYSQAAQTVVDAQKSLDNVEARFTKRLKNEEWERKGVYDSAEKNYEEYSKHMGEHMREAANAQTQDVEDSTETLINRWKDLDRQIKLEEISEEDKWKTIGDWFTFHPDWDKTNEDLVSYYANYRSFIKKQEEQTQSEQQKADQERTKQAEQAEKEKADAVKTVIKRGLTDIDHQRAMGELDDEAYYNTLEQHMKDYNDYYAENVDERISLANKIAEGRKGIEDKAAEDSAKALKQSVSDNLNSIEKLHKKGELDDKAYYDAITKHLKDYTDYYAENVDERIELEEKVTDGLAEIQQKSAEDYFTNWTNGYDSLVDKAVKTYQDIEKAANSYQQNLLKGVELTTKETERVWDRATHKYKEQQVEVVSSKSLEKQLQDIKDFEKAIKRLQAAGADENLISEIMGMGTDDGLEYANKLLAMSPGELQKYLSTYSEIYAETQRMTDDYFAESLESWKTEYWTPLQEYAKTGGDDLKKVMNIIGEDTINEWINGIESKRDEATGQTKQMYEDVLQTAKDALGIASPSKQFYSVGEFTIQGFLNGVQSKVGEIATIFATLGQKAGDSFVSAFQSTWGSFINLLNTSGGLSVPIAMTTSTFGTPSTVGGQTIYNNSAVYGSLTKDDIVSAVKEAMPSGDIVLQIDKSEFGRISRNSLNQFALESGRMGLRV